MKVKKNKKLNTYGKIFVSYFNVQIKYINKKITSMYDNIDLIFTCFMLFIGAFLFLFGFALLSKDEEFEENNIKRKINKENGNIPCQSCCSCTKFEISLI